LNRFCKRHLLTVVAACLPWLAACSSSPGLLPGSTRTDSSDGVIQAFIPEGEFLMGSLEEDPLAGPDEWPAHRVFLDSYWIDVTEVSNGEFAACVAAAGCTPPRHSFRYDDPSYRDHPVLGVAHDEAAAYCVWAGRRLPTEAEWEKAARGTDGRQYPWGNEPPDVLRANFSGVRQDTAAVGSFPAGASPYGVLDMAGNVWEWVSDAYAATYYAESPARNPAGAESVNQFVIRGGSWTAGPTATRSANRFWAYPRRNDTDGFRCAQGDG
jgi:eukaryotic-like serine/threonine-protein kinase